jgi:hypothetical protein
VKERRAKSEPIGAAQTEYKPVTDAGFTPLAYIRSQYDPQELS